MGTIKVILPDELEKEFREAVFKQMGMKKGNLTLAVEEAIKTWVETQRKRRSGIAKKAWETIRAKRKK